MFMMAAKVNSYRYCNYIFNNCLFFYLSGNTTRQQEPLVEDFNYYVCVLICLMKRQCLTI